MTGPGDIPSVTPTVTLIPGAGIVIRTPAFLCLTNDAVPASFLTDLLDIESAVVVPDSAPRRGRHLVRALAQLVATADDPVDIAFAAPDNAGIAIFLSGRVYGETDGKRIEPPAGDSYDRAVPWPFEGLGLYLAGTMPAEVGDERFDLVQGTVPAAGALREAGRPPAMRRAAGRGSRAARTVRRRSKSRADFGACRNSISCRCTICFLGKNIYARCSR